MTVFDFVFLGIVLLSMLWGAWRGLVSEVISLAGWCAALFVAWKFAAHVAPVIPILKGNPTLQWCIAFVVIVIGVLLMAALLRFLLRELVAAIGLSLSDRMAGAVFGVARGVLFAVILVALAGVTAMPRENWWREAVFAPPLETVVIALKPHLPKDLAARIRYR